MSDSQDAKNARRARERALATAAGENGLWNPADIKARVDAGVDVPTGARLQFTSLRDLLDMGIGGGGSPVESMGIEQWLAQNNMSPQEFQAQYGGLPYVFNDDGTVTYDPSAQRVAFEYTPASYARNQMIGLGLIGALGGAGLMGLGQGAAAGAAGEAAAAGAAAEAAAGGATSGLAGLGEFSLAAPGAGIGGVGTAGTGLSLGAGSTGGIIGSTAAELAAAGGVGLGGISGVGAGTGAGLGLDLGTTGGVIGQTAGNLANAAGVGLDTITSTGSGIGSGTTVGSTTAGGGTAGGTATGVGTQAARTGLSKFIFDTFGVDVDPTTLDLIGKLASTGIGIYGAGEQADAAKEMFNQYWNLGAPYRADLAKLNADPSSFYSSPIFQGALQQGSDALSRSLSAKVGNPVGNPTAMQEMLNYTTRGSLDAYNNRWNQLASAGQLGVSQAAPLGQQANAASGNTYNALGAGLASVFGTQRDYTGELLDLMRSRPSSGSSGDYLNLPGRP